MFDDDFWARVARLEKDHLRLQVKHDAARRALESTRLEQVAQLREVWGHYCEVIADLDRVTEEFEHLRSTAVP